ncbi:MAG: hypothetical protein U0992_23805 [Planctomycetaceae bacterium]
MHYAGSRHPTHSRAEVANDAPCEDLVARLIGVSGLQWQPAARRVQSARHEHSLSRPPSALGMVGLGMIFDETYRPFFERVPQKGFTTAGSATSTFR